jgi:hypothetical protein
LLLQLNLTYKYPSKKRVPVMFHHLILPLSNVAAAAYDLTYKYPNKKRVPVMFHQLMEQSLIPTERRYYWWRAQSTAYTVRPNERTLAELQHRKR